MLFLIAAVFVVAVVCYFLGALNPNTYVTINTPFESYEALLPLLLIGCVVGGMLFTWLVMATQRILTLSRTRQRERELRDRLKEKEQLLNEAHLRARNAEDRLVSYEAKVRDFTLQVMQISQSLNPTSKQEELSLPSSGQREIPPAPSPTSESST